MKNVASHPTYGLKPPFCSTWAARLKDIFIRRPLLHPRSSLWLLRGLILLGHLALGYYFMWWIHPEQKITPLLAAGLVIAAVYNWTQLLGAWWLYLAIQRRPNPPPPLDCTIDVLIPAYDEPYAMIEKTLRAACAMRGAHRTWLLDDSENPRLAQLAERLGAGYLTRSDRRYAKAGNINAGLAQTDSDLVVIFDTDHVPAPDFLERTTGYFRDPAVGFVQVMLTFSNARESWIARAAAESTLDFYNPTCMGADGLGSATLIGSNAVIRRSALDIIGGYQPGLAEDLATSIALHAAGWSSVYVAEPLAPGLAPPDLPAWFTQQLKWARGVFELLLTQYPRYFPRLTWGQRLSYAVRMTYYWIGPVTAIHLLCTLVMLIGGKDALKIDFHAYLTHILPLFVSMVLIRQWALQVWRHPTTSTAPLWRPVILVFTTWPIYTLAWLMALLRVPLRFRSTPKRPTDRLHPAWLFPQLVGVIGLGAGIIHASFTYDLPWLILYFALLQSLPPLILFYQVLKSRWGREARSHLQESSLRPVTTEPS